MHIHFYHGEQPNYISLDDIKSETSDNETTDFEAFDIVNAEFAGPVEKDSDKFVTAYADPCGFYIVLTLKDIEAICLPTDMMNPDAEWDMAKIGKKMIQRWIDVQRQHDGDYTQVREIMGEWFSGMMYKEHAA